MKKTIGVEYKGGACDTGAWPPHTKSPPKQVLLLMMDSVNYWKTIGNYWKTSGNYWKTIGVEYKEGACDSAWPPHTKSPPKQVLLVM